LRRVSRIAQRDRKAAILVLATYLPTDVAAGEHPIRSVHQDLHIHGLCTALALDWLARSEVERYLALRFGSPGLAEKLVVQIFARTGGQLLLVISLIDHLIAQRAPRATVQEVARA